MAEVSEEVSLGGNSSDLLSQATIDDCNADLSELRREMRKRSLRFSHSRSRRAFSSPKSPLMRMAEMRKGGLRGKALRHPGKKGSDEMGSLLGKGKKGVGGMGSSVLPAIPEGLETGEGSLGGLEPMGCDSDVLLVSGDGETFAGPESGKAALEVAGGGLGAEGAARDEVGLVLEMGDDRNSLYALISPTEGVEGGCSALTGETELMSDGLHSDLALDLISAQPLQEMAFIGGQAAQAVVVSGGADCIMQEQSGGDTRGGSKADEFPHLCKENLRVVKGKEKVREGGEMRCQCRSSGLRGC